MDLDQRAAGVLCHLTSLPGPHGSGDLGASARAFADFLAAAGCGWWQMLPVSPAGAGNSPYSGSSAFAGNPLLISLEDLRARGLLLDEELGAPMPEASVDFARTTTLRRAALRIATKRLGAQRPASLISFRKRARSWLPAYALFMALAERHGTTAWTTWPRALARRDPDALAEAERELANEISHVELEQLLFDEQWQTLRAYCAERAVGLIGDIPIFVAHDSADVWANQAYFRLDADGEATHVAGVPPDYFSKTGQRWGNPHYRWKRLARDGYKWWIDRFRGLLERFDVVRLDHFIGFVRYWEIPASAPTAEHGRFMKGPGAALFAEARRVLGDVPFIAEDLGAVTPKVTALREEFGLPGMRVLQFAFGNDAQAATFLPYAFEPRTVAYTGTHDNDTIVGWFEEKGDAGGPRSPEQAATERQNAVSYLEGPDHTALTGDVHWEMIRCLYGSVANTVIVPLQDILGLDNRARMNVPGQAEGNWTWRVSTNALTPKIAERLRALGATYGRVQRVPIGQTPT